MVCEALCQPVSVRLILPRTALSGNSPVSKGGDERILLGVSVVGPPCPVVSPRLASPTMCVCVCASVGGTEGELRRVCVHVCVCGWIEASPNGHKFYWDSLLVIQGNLTVFFRLTSPSLKSMYERVCLWISLVCEAGV